MNGKKEYLHFYYFLRFIYLREMNIVYLKYGSMQITVDQYIPLNKLLRRRLSSQTHVNPPALL